MAIGVIGTESMANSKSPLQLVANSLTTPAIHTIITIGASTAMLGVLLSQILGISRMMLAMGRRKDLPPIFQKVHKHHRVPHIGIVTTGILILLLTLTGSFEFILRTATFTILLYYSITNIAAFKQPSEQRLFGKLIPVFGLLGCLVMSASLPLYVIASGVGILVVGFAIRYLMHKI